MRKLKQKVYRLRKRPGVEPGENQHLKRGQRGLKRNEQRKKEKQEIVVSWKLREN